MHVEYIGVNDLQFGTGTLHKVHAWWRVGENDKGEVKRAASAEVRKVVGKGGSVTVHSCETGTYKHPDMDAVVLVRVMTDSQKATRRELKSRRYTECGGCGGFPGQLVLLTDGTEQAMCFTCWSPLRGTGVKVVHYIQRDGRLQIN